MSTIAIKNIIHKYTEKSINIIYEPTYSLFDYLIYDLPFNFFMTKPYIIDKPNVIYPRDLSLFSYDMLFCHNQENNDLALKLHLPIVRYIHTYALENVQGGPNIFTVLENAEDVGVPSFFSVSMPIFNMKNDIKVKKDSVLINSRPAGLDNKVIEFLKDKIPRLDIIDHTNNLLNICQYKTVIDLYPTNQTNMLYALNNNVCYLTTTQKNTIKYAEQYKNVYHASTVLDLIEQNQQCLQSYSDKSFDDIQQKFSYKWQDQMTDVFSTVKSTGFYL